MPSGFAGPRPDERNWQKNALVSGGAGLWEWHHSRRTARFCTGAAALLAGHASLAWQNLTIDQAFSNVETADATRLASQLSSATNLSNGHIGKYWVRSDDGKMRRVLLRGRTQADLRGEPLTMGVVIDVTDSPFEDVGLLGGPEGNALDEAAQHLIAAYNALRETDNPLLLAPARALLLAVGREIAGQMVAGRRH